MKKIILNSAVFIVALFSFDGGYEIPPSYRTYGYVPVISDELMKQCVVIYNKALALERALSSAYVNEYSSYEVESYNQKVRTHTYMIDWYNLNCAGKQSYSACKAAQELNREKGLPTQSCGN